MRGLALRSPCTHTLLRERASLLPSTSLPASSALKSIRRAQCVHPPAAASTSAPSQEKPERERGPSRADAPQEAGASKGMIDTQPPRGTRDFYPEEHRFRNWLFGEFAAVSNLFGFEQWDAPVLESEDLYKRKAGEEITDQLYNFEDKGQRRVALRPELTPSLARLVLAKQKVLPLPAKWFAIGQCWRYERMTRGRRREHYQWNMDIIGVAGVEAEAELLAAITLFFERVGLTSNDVGIKVSNRKVLQAVMERYNVPADKFAPVCVIVDKIDKLPREQVEKELSALGVNPDTIEGVLSAMSLSTIDDLQQVLGEESEAVAELRQLFRLAEGYGYSNWLKFDPSVVRGLAYYTGTVFEGFDREGKLRAICGGGRYDKLLGTFGGENIPCCGFGFGDAVIVELLKERNKIPVLKHQVDDVIVALDEGLRPAASGIAHGLRRSGRRVELVMESKKMKWAFKHAERLSASRLVLVGASEWSRGTVSVKDLALRDQKEMSVAELLSSHQQPQPSQQTS